MAPRPTPVYLAVGVLSWPILKGLFRYRSTGLDRLPRDGGYVLAANHLSNFDPWALGMALFPRRFLRFMAKSELFWFPLGPIIRAGGAFPVRRGTGDSDALATAVGLCREGHAVVMFPEGTRRQKGLRKTRAAHWHTGAARIALEADVPLVPAGISGTDRLARLGPIRVAYGHPIDVGDLHGRPPAEGARAATDRLADAITELERSLA